MRILRAVAALAALAAACGDPPPSINYAQQQGGNESGGASGGPVLVWPGGAGPGIGNGGAGGGSAVGNGGASSGNVFSPVTIGSCGSDPQGACDRLLAAWGGSTSCDAVPDTTNLIGQDCIRDGYIAAAIDTCWAAGCSTLPANCPIYFDAVAQDLSNALELCSGAPALGNTCRTLSIWPCP